MPDSLMKIPLILCTATAVDRMFTPPMPAAAKEERVQPEGVEKVFQYVARLLPYLAKSAFWTASLAEATVILALKYPSQPLFKHLLYLLTGSSHLSIKPLRISPIFLLGTALTIGGALFRIASFRAMGKQFTYELTVQRGHRLITAFPYSIVRHPGYAGALAAVAGVNITMFGARGGFVRDVVLVHAGWDELPRRGLVTATMVGVGMFQAAVSFALLSRVPQEDAMMKKEFGKEWHDWARRVPYKLVPGIY